MLYRAVNLSTRAIANARCILHKAPLNQKVPEFTSIQFKSTKKFPARTTKPNLTQTVVSELSSEAPQGVRPEFYQDYFATFSKLAHHPSEPVVIKHSELNSILLKLSTKEELELMPSLIEHWRRRQLPAAGFVSRYTFWKMEELESPEVGFKLIADRHSYGLFPLTREFNRVLRSYSKQLSTLQASEELNEEICKTTLEKMMMTYSLIFHYEQLPNPETYQILIDTIVNSPLKESWFGRVHQLVVESKHHRINLEPTVLSNLKPLYELYRPQASNTV